MITEKLDFYSELEKGIRLGKIKQNDVPNLKMAISRWLNYSPKNIVGERWFDIPKFENRYQISNYFRVKSLPKKENNWKPKILRPFRNNWGYMVVCLYNKGQFPHSIHVIIGKMFIPNEYKLPELNHKNGCKWDFRKKNLEWTTKSGNAIHAYEMGMRLPTNGTKNGMCKLKSEQVIDIFNSSESKSTLAKKHNISERTIMDIKTKRSWSFLTSNIISL